MSLADDTRSYVAVPTPIEEVEVGSEIDAGVGFLVQVTDTDGAAQITLTFDDHNGDPATVTVPAGELVRVYVPIADRADADGIPRFTAEEKAWARQYMQDHLDEFGPRDWPDPLMASAFWRLDPVSRQRFRSDRTPYPPLPDKAISVLSRMFGGADRRPPAEHPERRSDAA